MNEKNQETRTALVTGASRGLGAEVCRRLAEQGLRVLATSRAPSGEKLVQQLAGAGHDAEYHPLDVTNAASVEKLANELASAATRLDVLVNNAGVALNGFNATVARDTLETNFFGVLRVTDALLPLIPSGGCIVMVSSGMGDLSCVSPALRAQLLDPQLSISALCELMQSFVVDVQQGRHQSAGWPSSAYSVSKVGLNALTRILARDLVPRQIRINAVCPGWVRTDMGGSSAPRSLKEGAASIIWATASTGPTGGFFRDGVAIDW